MSEEDQINSSPFTQPLTASIIMEKERQVKEKAHPPGTSKILSKAREKAQQEESKTATVSVDEFIKDCLQHIIM